MPTLSLLVCLIAHFAHSAGDSCATFLIVRGVLQRAQLLWYRPAGLRKNDEQQIGDRRVRLISYKRNGHTVTIEVLGPNNMWVDISFQADRHLRRKAALARFAQRLAEQERRLRRTRK